MSRLAPLVDAARSIDRTNWDNTFLSYYTFGAAIGLGFDLAIREHTSGRVTLDDFMRAMWRAFGKPGGTREGYVDKPYSIGDAEATLASVSGDAAFARDFFARYIQGHELADYTRLLERAGFAVRPRNPGRPWLGDLRLERGARVAGLVASTWPIYAAGIDQDDELQQVGGLRIGNEADLQSALQRRKPGDSIAITFVDRTGVPKTATITLVAEPHLEVTPIEGAPLTSAQKAFRERWLGAAVTQ
jgi:predicted metalloprotease with PDZ domain